MTSASSLRPCPTWTTNSPDRASRYFFPFVSQMYAPSPRSMVGTGLSAYADILVKCIHRWSAAEPGFVGSVSVLSVVCVVIGYPIGRSVWTVSGRRTTRWRVRPE